MEILPSPEASENPYADLAAQDLQRQLERAARQENLSVSRIQRAQDRLGSITTADSFRANAVYDTSEVVGERKITDPFKHGPEPLRAPETFIGGKTLGKAIGRFALHFSLDGPRGNQIEEEARDQTGVSPSSFLGRRADIKNAERIRAQELRQARSKHSESVFSAGQGLGQKAYTRSANARSNERRSAKRQYREGILLPEN